MNYEKFKDGGSKITEYNIRFFTRYSSSNYLSLPPGRKTSFILLIAQCQIILLETTTYNIYYVLPYWIAHYYYLCWGVLQTNGKYLLNGCNFPRITFDNQSLSFKIPVGGYYCFNKRPVYIFFHLRGGVRNNFIRGRNASHQTFFSSGA